MRYPADLIAQLSDAIGPDTPVHVGLRGGETIWIGPDMRYEIIHTPGHSAGHLALWDRQRRAADHPGCCALARRAQPARQGAEPSLILLCERLYRYDQAAPGARARSAARGALPDHTRAEIAAFFATSLSFVDKIDEAVLDVVRSAKQPLPLSAVIAALDKRLGPFTTAIQWVGPALAHLGQHVAARRLRVQSTDAGRVWEIA